MSRNAPNGENGENRQRAGDSNWMPKVAPLESGDFGEIGDLAKMANLDGEGWRLKLDGKSVPLKSGDFDDNGDFT